MSVSLQFDLIPAQTTPVMTVVGRRSIPVSTPLQVFERFIMAILTTNISSSICGLHHFPRTAYLDLPLLVPSCPLPASRLVNSSRSIHPQTQYVLRPEPHDIGADPLVPVKLLFLLIILANAPSFPFLWHLRVWYTPLKAYFLVYTRGRSRYLDEWKRDNARKGGVKVVTRLRRIAWLDDCDYNLHLSNSYVPLLTDPRAPIQSLD